MQSALPEFSPSTAQGENCIFRALGLLFSIPKMINSSSVIKKNTFQTKNQCIITNLTQNTCKYLCSKLLQKPFKNMFLKLSKKKHLQ
jgi:hypothetical protein